MHYKSRNSRNNTVRGTVFAPLNAHLIILYVHISSEMTNSFRIESIFLELFFILNSKTIVLAFKTSIFVMLQKMFKINKYFSKINKQQVDSVSFFTASSKIIVPASKTLNFVNFLFSKWRKNCSTYRIYFLSLATFLTGSLGKATRPSLFLHHRSERFQLHLPLLILHLAVHTSKKLCRATVKKIN